VNFSLNELTTMDIEFTGGVYTVDES
jgi:hypothetical protein